MDLSRQKKSKYSFVIFLCQSVTLLLVRDVVLCFKKLNCKTAKMKKRKMMIMKSVYSY